MDVMSRSFVRDYLVITELYKGGKRVLQTKYTRAAFSMELLFEAIDIRNDTVWYPSRAWKYKKQQ